MESGLQKFLKKRLEREVFTGLPLTIFVIVFIVLLASFIGITDSIISSAPIVTLDSNFENYLFMYRVPQVAQFFYIVTHFASQITVGFLLILAIVYLYLKKETAYLYALLLSFIGSEFSIYLIKMFINRARPPANIAYYVEDLKSFPSGHSSVVVAFFGFITYYIFEHVSGRHKKSLVLFLGLFFVILIGFSRLYLGVHFLSDVLGGYLIGGLWLVASITFRERHFYATTLRKGKDPALE